MDLQAVLHSNYFQLLHSFGHASTLVLPWDESSCNFSGIPATRSGDQLIAISKVLN